MRAHSQPRFCRRTVVHVTSGVSALVTAIYLGKRLGYPHTNMPPHSMVLSFIGACLLWVVGSIQRWQRSRFRPLATSAFVNTISQPQRRPSAGPSQSDPQRQADRVGRHFRAVAGSLPSLRLGFVQPFSALLIALSRGFLLVHGLRSEEPLGYDDSLDAFGVHGAGGTLGALLTGFFATSASMRPLERVPPARWTDTGARSEPGSRRRIAWCISIVGTFVLLFVVDKVIGLRVSARRICRLDLSQHGEEATTQS